MKEIELAFDYVMTFESCTCLVVFAQECGFLDLCVPYLIHNSSKVSTSTLDENVNQALNDIHWWKLDGWKRESKLIATYSSSQHIECSMWKHGSPPNLIWKITAAFSLFSAWIILIQRLRVDIIFSLTRFCTAFTLIYRRWCGKCWCPRYTYCHRNLTGKEKNSHSQEEV